jgi:hypothetical protein
MKGRFRSSRHPNRTITHECPHPDCFRQVPPLMWSCFEHWQGLPAVIRQDIWTAGRGTEERTLELRMAAERACAFWEMEAADAPPSEQTRRYG